MAAVELLHGQLVRIEALALLACEAADQLQPPPTPAGKRELIRMQILVEQTAAEASHGVTAGDRLVAGLVVKNRRQAPPGEPSTEISGRT
jgi:hypothetical protein